jgi:Leucine-rich repeat (LRR) protein
VILIVNVFGVLKNVETNELLCEKVDNIDWPHAEEVETCWMQNTTVIDQKTMRISNRDGAVRALAVFTNKQIHYLPIGIKDTFPHLEFMSAGQCAVREVSKENFAGLSNLTALWLEQNQIEKISSDTFEDLVSLKHLWLCKKIKTWIYFENAD